MSESEWLGHQVESSATEEQYLQLLSGIQQVLTRGAASPEDASRVALEAITTAMGGSIADAILLLDSVLQALD